jgi:hypothetical protein
MHAKDTIRSVLTPASRSRTGSKVVCGLVAEGLRGDRRRTGGDKDVARFGLDFKPFD